jgi:hypothetical protein
MGRLLLAVVLAMVGIALVGCQGGETPKVETLEAPPPDPLVEAKNILTNYANGMPVTSEAEGFPNLISRVKEKDPAKGAILEKGLTEIAAQPTTAKAKATELLKQL